MRIFQSYLTNESLISCPSFIPVVFAISVIWRNSRIPARDLLPTQLPSSVGAEEGLEIDDEVTMAWASANVADGIEDDSLEPEGHVRLR